MARRRTFTPEFKARVVLEVLTGAKSMAEACREYQVRSQVLSRWKVQFLEQAPTIFERASDQSGEQERIAELERMVGRLTMELEVVKKASDILSSPSIRNGR
jgi:transposase-like protein